jgi:alpha-amylase
MGEVFNGNPAYVGDYQNYLTGLFNYPMYYTIRDVFISGQSMHQISSRYAEESSKFRDLDALGLFVDNHDNARFLSQSGSSVVKFKSALAFALTARGIPFMYYGSEQGFSGGADPNNREPLWNSFS